MSTVWVILICGALLAVPGALYLLHRLCLWLESKGQLYYRDRQPTSSAAASCVALQQLIEPSAREIVLVEEQAAEDGASGDGDNGFRLAPNRRSLADPPR